MAIITNNPSFPTQSQVPSNSILDINGRQTYLGNHFCYSANNITLSNTAETNLALIVNPATNTKSLFLNLRRVSSTADLVQFKFYANPTVTNAGTPVTPVNLRIANSNTSSATVSHGQTTSANGTLILTLEATVDYYVTTDSDLLIILDPGNSLMSTATAAGATVVNLNVAWYEL